MKNNPSSFGTPVVVVSFEELLDMLMDNIFCYRRKDNILVKLPSKNKSAVINGLRGVEIEKIYSKCLSNEKNYNCYINNYFIESRRNRRFISSYRVCIYNGLYFTK